MDIFQITGIGIISTIIIVILKSMKPDFAMYVAIVTGIVIFMLLIGKISAVVDLLREFSVRVNIKNLYLNTLLKITGIAYIAEFGAEICRDAGESAVASKIELAGKVLIMVIAAPVITSLLDLIINIMP